MGGNLIVWKGFRVQGLERLGEEDGGVCFCSCWGLVPGTFGICIGLTARVLAYQGHFSLDPFPYTLNPKT